VKLLDLVNFITKKNTGEFCRASVFLSRIGFYCINSTSFYSVFNFKLCVQTCPETLTHYYDYVMHMPIGPCQSMYFQPTPKYLTLNTLRDLCFFYGSCVCVYGSQSAIIFLYSK
jgi:hypothetical protein